MLLSQVFQDGSVRDGYEAAVSADERELGVTCTGLVAGHCTFLRW